MLAAPRVTWIEGVIVTADFRWFGNGGRRLEGPASPSATLL